MTVLVKQKTLCDCGLAAIAMAAGKEYDDLWKAEDTASLEGVGMTDTEQWIDRAGFTQGIDFRMVYIHGRELSTVKALLWKRRALLSVKSLNNERGNHLLFWDGDQVFDPATRQTYQYLQAMIIDVAYIFSGTP